jgi:hypothetical protein
MDAEQNKGGGNVCVSLTKTIEDALGPAFQDETGYRYEG